MAQLIPTLPVSDRSGFEAQCLLCEHQDPGWPTATQAQDAAVWHVYETHPQHWRDVIGGRAPLRPKPRKAA